MNKKIISILFLLIIFASIALAYNYLTKESSEEAHYGGTDTDVDNSDLADEVDDSFIDEDGEVEIGEMV